MKITVLTYSKDCPIFLDNLFWSGNTCSKNDKCKLLDWKINL